MAVQRTATVRRPLAVRVERATFERGAGTAALAGIVAGSAAVVVAAAQGGARYLSPVLHHSGPAWMAGPLSGLWPGRPSSSVWLEHALLFDLLAMLACYVVALACAQRLRARVVWGAVIAVHVIYLLSPPLLQTDVFNYAQYARMGTLHGLNPYTHVPVAAAGDPVFPLTTWTHMRSAYGPLFTLITYALVPLGIAGSFWAFKVLLMLASLGLVTLVWHLARRLDRDPTRAVVLCGLNPTVLVYALGGDHNDAFTMIPVLGALAFMLRRREAAGAAAMVGAVAMKASAAVLLPVALLAGGRWRRTFAGAAAGALVFGGATLLAFGPHIPAVGDQSRLVTLYSIPNFAGYVLGFGGETAFLRLLTEVALGVGTIAISVWAWRRRAPLEGLGWVTLLALVTLGWDMAWYLVWLLPFVALVESRRFRIAAAAVVVWWTIQWLPMASTGARIAFGLTPNTTVVWCKNQLVAYRLGGLPHRAVRTNCERPAERRPR